MNSVSVEAFDIFSQGAVSECDSECSSVAESGKWSSALVSYGEMSDSGWEFGSECGSVDVSGVLVVLDVGEAAPSVVTVICGGVPSDSARDFVELQSFSFSKKHNFACVEEQEDMNYDGTLVKAPPCSKKRMRTPLPQQSPFSSMEEGSPWSAQERAAIANMQHYVGNSDCIKLEIGQVEVHSLGSQCSDVDVKHILKKKRKEKAYF